MNYVNLENAKALKELGFDVPVTGYYFPDRLVSSDELRHDRFLSNFNHADFSRFSAPDFLTAADWLFDKYKVSVCFKNESWFVRNNNRNAAISYAIEQIKSRENETQD